MIKVYTLSHIYIYKYIYIYGESIFSTNNSLLLSYVCIYNYIYIYRSFIFPISRISGLYYLSPNFPVFYVCIYK